MLVSPVNRRKILKSLWWIVSKIPKSYAIKDLLYSELLKGVLQLFSIIDNGVNDGKLRVKYLNLLDGQLMCFTLLSPGNVSTFSSTLLFKMISSCKLVYPLIIVNCNLLSRSIKLLSELLCATVLVLILWYYDIWIMKLLHCYIVTTENKT